jgi:hypothetical protein
VDEFTHGPMAQAILAYTKKDIGKMMGLKHIYVFASLFSSPNDLRTYIVFINHIKKQNLFGHH